MLYRAQATAAKKRKLEESKNSAPVASKTCKWVTIRAFFYIIIFKITLTNNK